MKSLKKIKVSRSVPTVGRLINKVWQGSCGMAVASGVCLCGYKLGSWLAHYAYWIGVRDCNASYKTMIEEYGSKEEK